MNVTVKVVPIRMHFVVVLKTIRGKEPAGGRDKEVTAVFYKENVF